MKQLHSLTCWCKSDTKLHTYAQYELDATHPHFFGTAPETAGTHHIHRASKVIWVLHQQGCGHTATGNAWGMEVFSAIRNGFYNTYTACYNRFCFPVSDCFPACHHSQLFAVFS